MAIQIGQKPSPTFQHPLELLSDCHRRVESFLRALLLVTEQARGGELNAQQRKALETALRYFREAAPKHTADEEESLFPRLCALDGDTAREAFAKIEALEADHQIAKSSHTAIDELGQTWLSAGSLSAEATERMLQHLRTLELIYARHIAVEDNEIFPLAQRTLDAQTLDEVGREMAQRRSVDFVWPRR